MKEMERTLLPNFELYWSPDQMRKLLNIVAMETTIKNVGDLHITGSTAFRMTETSKTALKNLIKQLPPA